MGSFGAGIASVGGSIAQAQELRRQQRMEDIRLALEQERLKGEQARTDVEKEYAQIAGGRAKLEQQQLEENLRLSRLPKFVGFRTVGGRLYYGLQNPDGTVTTREVTGANSAKDAAELEGEIEALPQGEAQDIARRMVSSYLTPGAEDYPAARAALKGPIQKFLESKFPGQATISTSQVHLVVDDPKLGPIIKMVPKTTTTQKVPQAGQRGAAVPVTPATSGRVPGFPELAMSTLAKQAGKTTHPPLRPSVPPVPKPAMNPSKLNDSLGLPKEFVGKKPPNRGDINKISLPELEADKRYLIMEEAVRHPNPQGDVALTFNHIGMTLSAQRGARITNAEIQRAIISRSLPEDLQALWSRVINGQFLTPQERQNMLALARHNRELIWRENWEIAVSERLADHMPNTMKGLPPVPGVHFIGEDVTSKSYGRARITQVNPDGTFEYKPY